MPRQKITITIRKEILKRVDQVIDNNKIRNRSHAVEYLLNQSLFPKISKALILCGGKGVKMKPFTEELPKSLLSVKGKPILEYQIDLLRSFDIREIFILIGHLGDKIKYYFGDGSRFGVKIHYIEQKSGDIGTGHALHLSKTFLSGEPFLLFYGDELIKINLKDFIDFHVSSGALSTVALSSLEGSSLYGVVNLRGKRIIGFWERPKNNKNLSRIISAGVFCFEPQIFNYLNSRKKLSLERDIFPRLAQQEKLNGYLFEGNWFDVGTTSIYEKAIREWV